MAIECQLISLPVWYPVFWVAFDLHQDTKWLKDILLTRYNFVCIEIDSRKCRHIILFRYSVFLCFCGILVNWTYRSALYTFAAFKTTRVYMWSFYNDVIWHPVQNGSAHIPYKRCRRQVFMNTKWDKLNPETSRHTPIFYVYYSA